MKEYPSIDLYRKGIFGETVIAFDKLDGSNFRCEWSRKRGWYKFGSRSEMIDQSHWLGGSIPIFLAKYGDRLDKHFRSHKAYRNCQNFTVFSEYIGPNSFAGFHDFVDMDVVLFDVNQFRRGIIPPREFVDNFGEFGIPRIVYIGNYNKSLVLDVRSGKYDVKEGTVCKGIRRTKGQPLVWMVKIKTAEWLKRLRNLKGIDAVKTELNGDLTEWDEICAEQA
jgi:hypothetical protein